MVLTDIHHVAQSVADKHMRRKKLGVESRALRLCGTVSLFVWLAAIVVCSTEPLRSHHNEQAVDSHALAHKSGDDSHSDGSPSEGGTGGHDDPFCDALQAITLPHSELTLIHPDFSTPNGLFLAPISKPDSLHSFPKIRHAYHAVWVFTPSVCLGAAAYSNGPPFQA